MTSNTQSAFVSPYSWSQVLASRRRRSACAAALKPTGLPADRSSVIERHVRSCRASRRCRDAPTTVWKTCPATKLLPRTAMSSAGTDVLPSRTTVPPSCVTPVLMAANLMLTSSAASPRRVLVSMLPEKWSLPPSTTASRMPDPICLLLGLKLTAFLASGMERTSGSKNTYMSNVPR